MGDCPGCGRADTGSGASSAGRCSDGRDRTGTPTRRPRRTTPRMRCPPRHRRCRSRRPTPGIGVPDGRKGIQDQVTAIGQRGAGLPRRTAADAVRDHQRCSCWCCSATRWSATAAAPTRRRRATTHNTDARGRLDAGPGADPGGDRDPVDPPAAPPIFAAQGRPDRQGDRQPMVLDLPISRQWRVRDRLQHAQGKERREARRALPHRRRRPAAAGGRRADGDPGRQGGEVHRHLQRRHPQLRRAGASGPRWTPSPAGSTRPGSRSTGPASITASASELCGARHGYMPIAVEVVPPAKFAAWVASKGGTMPGAAPPKPDSTAISPVSAAAVPAAAQPQPAAAPIRRRSSSPRPTRPRRPRIKSGNE